MELLGSFFFLAPLFLQLRVELLLLLIPQYLMGVCKSEGFDPVGCRRQHLMALLLWVLKEALLPCRLDIQLGQQHLFLYKNRCCWPSCISSRQGSRASFSTQRRSAIRCCRRHPTGSKPSDLHTPMRYCGMSNSSNSTRSWRNKGARKKKLPSSSIPLRPAGDSCGGRRCPSALSRRCGLDHTVTYVRSLKKKGNREKTL